MPAAAAGQSSRAVPPQEDPFYKKLYDEGKYFFGNRNYAGAVEDFTIASFGSLDNLPRLLECYICLTVSYFELKNYEKARYYIDEIGRLKLMDQAKAADLPEDLVKRYEATNARFAKAPPPKLTGERACYPGRRFGIIKKRFYPVSGGIP